MRQIMRISVSDNGDVPGMRHAPSGLPLLASGSGQPNSRATACTLLSRVQSFAPPMAAEASG